MLDLDFELLLIAADLVLFGSNHHQRLETLLLSISRTSFLILGLVLELFLRLLYLSLIGLELGFAHFVVSNLVGRNESMVIILFRFLLKLRI